MNTIYPFQFILELVCSAYRMNGGRSSLDRQSTSAIAHMVKQTIGLKEYPETSNCIVTEEDIEFAETLTQLFQRLHFDVLADRYMHDKKYERELYKLLTTGEVKINKISHMARAPGFSFLYLSACEIQKFLPSLKPGFIGQVLESITDTECQIITQSKCVNYPGYNVHGKINDHLVTWYTPKFIPEDNIVIKHANIKENGEEWFTGFASSRLERVYRK